MDLYEISDFISNLFFIFFPTIIDSVGISFIIDIIKNTKIRKIKAIKANKMVTASLRAVNLLYILQQSED